MARLPTIARDVTERPGTGPANEKLVDLFMERAIDLLRLEAGTRNKVVALLGELEKEIVGTLAKMNPDGPQSLRLTELLSVVTNSIRATYRTASTLLAQEIRDVVDIEATWTASAINASVHASFADAGLTRALLDTLVSNVLIQGAPTAEWWSRQAGGLAERFADEMRRGMALGEPNSKLIDRIRGTRTTKGLMDLSKTSAERLVRSSVQTAANVAREATYANNADLISSVDWSATLDTRTSIWCVTRDGLRYTPVEHRPIGHDIPWLEGPGKIHWNCRSSSIPRLKSWRELGIDENEVSETTRASMDGQVPADTTFEAWLKKQSVARQDTVLGAGKAQLWRDGKIEFRDLLDQGGRPLTTEALRAKARK